MPDGYMDAAAVPVPDAGDDTLRDELIAILTQQTPTAVYGDGTIKIVADPVADALLPLIREHVDRAVEQARAGERERIALEFSRFGPDQLLTRATARRIVRGQEATP